MKDQDDIKTKRPKGKDKMKEKRDRNGKYSAKHIRVKDIAFQPKTDGKANCIIR